MEQTHSCEVLLERLILTVVVDSIRGKKDFLQSRQILSTTVSENVVPEPVVPEPEPAALRSKGDEPSGLPNASEVASNGGAFSDMEEALDLEMQD